MELKNKNCAPIKPGTKPLDENQIKALIRELPPGWEVIDHKKIRKAFPFANFKRGMTFAQVIALIAEKQNHHPDICIRYQEVEIMLSTHSIGGLSENDFILAAKIDTVY